MLPYYSIAMVAMEGRYLFYWRPAESHHALRSSLQQFLGVHDGSLLVATHFNDYQATLTA
jgi:hypothetical protein